MKLPLSKSPLTILQQSQQDFIQDVDEITYLLTDQTNKLTEFIKTITAAKKYLLPATQAALLHAAKALTEEISRQRADIRAIKFLLEKQISQQQALTFVETKKIHYDLLRARQTRIAALITSSDWQSPSYDYSLFSQAGRQTGKIYATINDYKRDQHWDAHNYERQFVNAYIDGVIKVPIIACATSSGMAAFTTILNFLLFEGKVNDHIVVGASSYFQNKLMIQAALGPKIIQVEEKDTEAILRIYDTYRPSVVVLDSLTNSLNISVPDLASIVAHIRNTAKQETYIVIDNTGLSFTSQLYPLIFAKRSHVGLIVFESLNKYHQFGMD